MSHKHSQRRGRSRPAAGESGRLPLVAVALGSVVFAAGSWRYFVSSDSSIVGLHSWSERRQVDHLPYKTDLFLGDVSKLDAALATSLRRHADAVRRRPGDATALGRLGMLYEVHAFTDLARRCYAAAVSAAGRADSASARWRYHWAIVQYEAGERRAAEEAIRAVLSHKPDCAPAHERLGLWLLDRNAFDEAAEAFRRVTELRPREAPGYIGWARARLGAAERAPPARGGAAREAIELLNKALSINSKSKSAHYTLGRAYQLAGRHEEARPELSRGMHATTEFVRDPWRAEIQSLAVGRTAKLRRADAMLTNGRFVEAVTVFKELLAVDPLNVDAANALGLSLVSLGQPEKAKRVLLEALQAGRDSYKTHAHLAVAFLELGDLEQALQQADVAVRLAPQKEWVHFLRGRILSGLGRTASALRSFRDAARLDSPNPEVYVRMGHALTQLGRAQEAIEPLTTAVALRPRSAQMRFNLAIVYAQTGRLAQAATELRTALTLDPAHERARLTLDQVEGLLRR